MADYTFKKVATTSASATWVKDKSPIRKEISPEATWTNTKIGRANIFNRLLRPISSKVNSQGIEISIPYNGLNDLIEKIDYSKTKVERFNGFFGIGCTNMEIDYYDEDGNHLFTRRINEDKNLNKISFKGANGNHTVLWDNNNNGNFERMEQESQSGNRRYEWKDFHDSGRGDYDTVKCTRASGDISYERGYDFIKEKVVHEQSNLHLRDY